MYSYANSINPTSLQFLPTPTSTVLQELFDTNRKKLTGPNPVGGGSRALGSGAIDGGGQHQFIASSCQQLIDGINSGNQTGGGQNFQQQQLQQQHQHLLQRERHQHQSTNNVENNAPAELINANGNGNSNNINGTGPGGCQSQWPFQSCGHKAWPNGGTPLNADDPLTNSTPGNNINMPVLDDEFKLEYMVEYMELDEFLTENDIPLETVLQEQQQLEEEQQLRRKQQQQQQQQQQQMMNAPTPTPVSNQTIGNDSGPPSGTGSITTGSQSAETSPGSSNGTSVPSSTSSSSPSNSAVHPNTFSTRSEPPSRTDGDSSANGNIVAEQPRQDQNQTLRIKTECSDALTPSDMNGCPGNMAYTPGSGNMARGVPSLPHLGGGPGDNRGSQPRGLMLQQHPDLPPPPPPPPPLDVPQGSGRISTGLLRKRRKQLVSDEKKDEKYWERRRKNNMAAKRSRDARRAKETQVAIQATFLERENKTLAQELSKARAENHILRERLGKYERI